MAERYLIVGLGNPGKKYHNTRHNAGFMVIDELARRMGLDGQGRSERKALVADGMLQGKRVMLVQPQTYMNLSGEAVRALMDFYKIEIDQIIVIHDDLDLPLGELRIRKSGGHGGQNGVRNIIQHVGTRDFARIRFGIGRPPGKMKPVDFVLIPFIDDEKIVAREVTERAATAIETWLTEGIDIAMTRYNGNGNDKQESKPNPRELLKVYQRAHEVAPNDPKPLEKMVGVLKQLGKLDRAVEVHLQLAEMFESMGKMGPSITHRERASSIQPERIEIHHQIAEAYLAKDNKKKAVGRYLILARYLEEQGKIDDALQLVETALEINPQHPKALTMLESLTERD